MQHARFCSESEHEENLEEVIMQKVVLVHGYVRLDMGDALSAALGDHHVIECWQEGGYLLSLVTTEPVVEREARAILRVIYEHETEALPLHAKAGMLSCPVKFTMSEGIPVHFLGVMQGYEEAGAARYQD
jgi:hypothetical protein